MTWKTYGVDNHNYKAGSWVPKMWSAIEDRNWERVVDEEEITFEVLLSGVQPPSKISRVIGPNRRSSSWFSKMLWETDRPEPRHHYLWWTFFRIHRCNSDRLEGECGAVLPLAGQGFWPIVQSEICCVGCDWPGGSVSTGYGCTVGSK